MSVREDLAGITEALDADGYTLEVLDASETLSLRIRARPDACEECLVPPEIMAPTIAAATNGRYAAEQIRLEYPGT